MLQYIFIGNSVYALFLYCLRFYKQIDETLFLLGPSCTFANVNHCLPICAPRNINNMQIVKEALQQQVYLLLQGRKVPCYGNVETVFSDFFVHHFEFYPMTDGLRDTVTYPHYLEKNLFPKCYTVRYKGGLDMDHKNLEYIDIPKTWDALDEAAHQKIMSIFNVTPNDYAVLKEKTTLLLTQPLSEDNICSTEDKIKIYQRIVSQYDPTKLVIKAHPREITNWADIFPNVSILSNHIPAEMLSLTVPNLNKVVTFFSTAAFNMLSEEQIDFYGKDFTQLKFYTNGLRTEGNRQYKSIASFDVEDKYKTCKFNWLRIPDEDKTLYRYKETHTFKITFPS